MPHGWKPKPYAAVAKDLERAGFQHVGTGRGKGSHNIFKGHGRTVSVPNHGSKDVAVGTMRNIAKHAGMEPEVLFGSQRKGQGPRQEQEQSIDPREGVEDARGAVRNNGSVGRSGGRAISKRVGRVRDSRSR